MSASHEPSYYEIALTNRQVLTVFVVLLVCVVAAFFSGVWIGRRGGVETARAEVAQAEKPAVAEEATLKELRFFSDEPQRPGHRPLQESTQNPDRGSAPLEEPTREAVSGDETESRPVRRQASGPAPVDKAVQTSPPLPVVTETARSPGSVASGTRLLEGSAAAESTGDLVIQVFFSSDEEKAQSLVERLGGSGYPAFLSPVEVGGQVMYRVRLGPYRERGEAEAVADRVRRAFRLDTWITQ